MLKIHRLPVFKSHLKNFNFDTRRQITKLTLLQPLVYTVSLSRVLNVSVTSFDYSLSQTDTPLYSTSKPIWKSYSGSWTRIKSQFLHSSICTLKIAQKLCTYVSSNENTKLFVFANIFYSLFIDDLYQIFHANNVFHQQAKYQMKGNDEYLVVVFD